MAARRYILNRASLPLHYEFTLLGNRVALDTNSAVLISLVARSSEEGLPRSKPALTIRVLEDPSLPAGAGERLHFRGLHHLVFAWIGPGNFFTFDLLRGTVGGVVSPAVAGSALFWNRRLLPIAAGVLGTNLGVAPIHAACLEKKGRGLLIGGLSGAGKSTLSVALARRGFTLVSDDWTYLSRPLSSGAPLIARGLSAPVKLLPDAVTHFPELEGRRPERALNGELAFELDPAEYWHCGTKREAGPRTVLFLERKSEPGSQFLRRDPGEARSFFERQGERLPEELPEVGAARAAVLEGLSRCECWALRTGDPPARAAELVEQFLEAN
jgi:hypothetical protein